MHDFIEAAPDVRDCYGGGDVQRQIRALERGPSDVMKLLLT